MIFLFRAATKTPVLLWSMFVLVGIGVGGFGCNMHELLPVWSVGGDKGAKKRSEVPTNAEERQHVGLGRYLPSVFLLQCTRFETVAAVLPGLISVKS